MPLRFKNVTPMPLDDLAYTSLRGASASFTSSYGSLKKAPYLLINSRDKWKQNSCLFNEVTKKTKKKHLQREFPPQKNRQTQVYESVVAITMRMCLEDCILAFSKLASSRKNYDDPSSQNPYVAHLHPATIHLENSNIYIYSWECHPPGK